MVCVASQDKKTSSCSSRNQPCGVTARLHFVPIRGDYMTVLFRPFVLARGITQLLLLGILLLALSSTAVMAQTTASIKGTVTDASGSAVADAKVVVKSQALGIERTTQTNSSGDYEVPALPPGTYSVDVQAQGFATQLANSLTLQVSQNPVQNFGLKLPSSHVVWTVESTQAIIDSTSITVGQVI